MAPDVEQRVEGIGDEARPEVGDARGRQLREQLDQIGVSGTRVLRTVTLPFLRPALITAAVVAFLISFENFNTTLFLVDSEAPLTITMYDRMVKAGSTPVLNAVSVVLMIGSATLALISVLVQRDKADGG